MDPFTQSGYDARLAWGPVEAERLSTDAAAVVLVDVLSFSTAVDVAVSRGARVLPCADAAEAQRLARRHGGVAAVGRRAVDGEHPWSLSPATLGTLPAGARLVLGSPNGGGLCARLAASRQQAPDPQPRLLVACLRNSEAVAAALRHGARPVVLVAAGERWPDGSLRPAVEDLLGAGALLAALPSWSLSPEATAAAAAWDGVGSSVGPLMWASASARELLEGGFADDVEIACQVGVSSTVPVASDDGWLGSPSDAASTM